MTENQELLKRMLPPYYHQLCELPDEICKQLTTFAHYVTGDGLYAIQARIKLQKLLSMTKQEIIETFQKTFPDIKLNLEGENNVK